MSALDRLFTVPYGKPLLLRRTCWKCFGLGVAFTVAAILALGLLQAAGLF